MTSTPTTARLPALSTARRKANTAPLAAVAAMVVGSHRCSISSNIKVLPLVRAAGEARRRGTVSLPVWRVSASVALLRSVANAGMS